MLKSESFCIRRYCSTDPAAVCTESRAPDQGRMVEEIPFWL